MRFKTDDELRDYLEEVFECDPKTFNDILIADGHSEAFIGYTTNDPVRLVYSVPRVIKGLMKNQGMSYQKAAEFAEFNIFCAYVGEHTPLYVNDEQP